MADESDDYGANDSSTRKKLRHFFHSNTFHYALTIFIMLDLSIVVADIIIILIYCDDIPHDVEVVFDDLVIISLTILALFLVELSTQMYAFGPIEWLSHPMHVFDLVITLITFIAELVLHGNKSAESATGLLIVFRLWRLVRIVNVTAEALENEREFN